MTTSPRGGRPAENQGLPPRGGRPVTEPQGSPRGARAVPQIFTEVRSRDSGLDRQKDIGSPVDILVDTVARMPQDLATTSMDTPAPTPEVPAVERLLQRLVGETQSRPPPVVSPPEPTELEQMLWSFFAEQHQRQRPTPRQRPVRRDWNGVVCFSCEKSNHTATQYPNLDESGRRGSPMTDDN